MHALRTWPQLLCCRTKPQNQKKPSALSISVALAAVGRWPQPSAPSTARSTRGRSPRCPPHVLPGALVACVGVGDGRVGGGGGEPCAWETPPQAGRVPCPLPSIAGGCSTRPLGGDALTRGCILPSPRAAHAAGWVECLVWGGSCPPCQNRRRVRSGPPRSGRVPSTPSCVDPAKGRRAWPPGLCPWPVALGVVLCWR